MDSRNALIAFAAYIGVAVVLAAVCMAAVLWFGVSPRFLSADVTGAVADTSAASPARPKRARVAAPPTVVTTKDPASERQIRLLESIVDEKNKRLRELAEQLERVQSDLAELQSRYDTETSVMMDIFDTGAETGTSDEEAGTAPASGTSSREKMDAELAIAEAAQKKLLQDMETLQAELEKSNQDLAELQIQSLTEAARADTRFKQVEGTMVGLFHSIGTAAIPQLINALNNANPDVRCWVAEALGKFGSEAGDAVPVLTELLSDDNEQVRRAAKSALDSIGR